MLEFFNHDYTMVGVVDERFQMDWEVFIEGIGIFGWLNFWLNIFRGIFVRVRLLSRCALLLLSYTIKSTKMIVWQLKCTQKPHLPDEAGEAQVIAY